MTRKQAECAVAKMNAAFVRSDAFLMRGGGQSMRDQVRRENDLGQALRADIEAAGWKLTWSAKGLAALEGEE